MTDTAEEVCGSVDVVGIEHVVLVDGRGRPDGVLAKSDAHHQDTPLHLAFSVHLVRPDGSVLLTRRAGSKRTWPAVWTNGCCGHPQLGETLREALTRRVDEELGLRVRRVEVALADFAYRSEMADGTVEHELCPVLFASVDGEPHLDPDEVDALEWLHWDELVARVAGDPGSLSPWCVEHVGQLVELDITPDALLTPQPSQQLDELLDVPIEIGADLALAGRTQPDDDPLGSVARQLRPVLDTFFDTKTDELVLLHPELGHVAREIRELVTAGGKRLRPAFVYWGHRSAGAVHEPAVLRPAAAVELLHTFALLHDDVMDRSVTRRGRTSAFVSFGDLHRSAGAAGDPEWFGVSAAILAGDMAYVWADELFDSSEQPPEVMRRARRVFTDLRSEVIAGQYLDLHLAGTHGAAESVARQVAVLKSARYTVTRPLLLGAALAGVEDASVLDALTRYGDAVGLAFQMRDDVLGVFGDPDLTGKGRLEDLREGKRTVLVLRAMRLADPMGADVLRRSIGDPDLDEDAARRCREVIERSGALASVERLVAREHEVALGAIEALDGPARRALASLAATAIERWS